MARVTRPERSPPGGSPTLDEVARLAGVSRATASRAINGGNRVSAQAADRGRRRRRALGYTPNPAARSLVTRRTDSVALVVPEPDERVFSDPFFARTLRGVNRVLAERDLQLVLLLARPGEEEQRMLRYLRNRHVDGALVVSHHRARQAGRPPGRAGPALRLHRPAVDQRRPGGLRRHRQRGRRATATQELIERGCRRIGTIAGPGDMTAGVDRLAGWRAACRRRARRRTPSNTATSPSAAASRGRRRCSTRHPDLDGTRRRLRPDGRRAPCGCSRPRGPPGARRRRRRRLRRPRRRRAHRPAADHCPQPDRRDGRAGHPAAARADRRRPRRRSRCG